MRINLASVLVDDQQKALRFYTDILGFVDDVHAEYERPSSRGVTFPQPPTEMGPVTTAVFDDTCGNQVITDPGGALTLDVRTAAGAVPDR